MPFTLTVTATRVFGSKNPSGSSRRLMSPFLVRSKASWNPLRSPAVAVICAESRASVTSAGTGRTSWGPMRSVT
ncbi:hypothetical protein SGLAM104S_09199 [Streptomyces glaucescens]